MLTRPKAVLSRLHYNRTASRERPVADEGRLEGGGVSPESMQEGAEKRKKGREREKRVCESMLRGIRGGEEGDGSEWLLDVL